MEQDTVSQVTVARGTLEESSFVDEILERSDILGCLSRKRRGQNAKSWIYFK